MISDKEAKEMLEEIKEANILPNASTFSRKTDERIKNPTTAKKPNLDQLDGNHE